MRLYLLAAATLCVATVPTEAFAQPYQGQSGHVRYNSLEDNPYAVNFRVALHPFYAYIGTADSIGAYAMADYELSRTVAVRANVTYPYFNFTDSDRPSRFAIGEAMIRVHADEQRAAIISMVLRQTEVEDGTWTTSTDVPSTVRKTIGGRFGARYAQIPARFRQADNCPRNPCVYDSTRITAFVGFDAMTRDQPPHRVRGLRRAPRPWLVRVLR